MTEENQLPMKCVVNSGFMMKFNILSFYKPYTNHCGASKRNLFEQDKTNIL